MKDRYIILIAVLMVIFQTTLMQIFRIYGIMPNLILLWVVISAVLYPPVTSIKIAVYSGIILDIMSSKALAVHLSIFLVIVLVITWIEDKIFKENYVTPVVLIIAATVFYYVFMSVFHYFSTGHFLLFSRLFTHLLPESIYNVFVGLPLYILMVQRVDLKRAGR